MSNYFLENIINDLSEINKSNIEELDILNDDDYKKFKSSVDELKNSNIFNSFSKIFGLNETTLDSIVDIIDEYRNEHKKKEEKNKIIRPSENISTETGLQIHKLVQEYVDTMIKPYNPKNGGLTIDQINNAYAGIYEYSCWLYQHK